eukprot:scaffold34664_cov16-Prasinocladus_malaysianus.AAC.2
MSAYIFVAVSVDWLHDCCGRAMRNVMPVFAPIHCMITVAIDFSVWLVSVHSFTINECMAGCH